MTSSDSQHPSSDKPSPQVPVPDKFAHLLEGKPAKPKLTVTPRTRILLISVLTLFSLLLANGLYLSGVTFSEYWFQRSFQDLFYHYMFLAHLVLGLVLVLPFLAFGCLLYTSPSPRDLSTSRMPSSA